MIARSAAAVLLAATILAGCGSGADAPKLHGLVRTPPLQVGDAALPDVAPGARGRTVAFRAPGSGLLLVYFGYTFCPDVCPTTMADLRLALARLSPDQRRRVSAGMVTVDPARDTPRVLNGYLRHFFPSWRAYRTTDRAQLRSAERAFNAASRLGKKAKDGSYPVVHTSEIYAVDDRGTVRAEWPFGTTPADIAADLHHLLTTTSPKGPTT